MSREWTPETFWARVTRGEPDECWPWLGGVNDSGYGMAWNGWHMLGAHRLSWELVHGRIPDGQVIRHSCDNPICVNPDHLLIGTHADNIADKVARNRQARGEANGRARLTLEQVRDIRRRGAAGETAGALALEYGVDRRSIVYILKRVNWRWAA